MMATKYQDEIINNPHVLDATLKGYREEVLRRKEEREQNIRKTFQEMIVRLAAHDASSSPSMSQ